MPAVNAQQILDPPDIDWSKLWEKIISYASHVLHALTVANKWTVDHPYFTVCILLCICVKPVTILKPFWLIGKTILCTCLLVWQLVTWPFKTLGRFVLRIIGFMGQGVERDSLASHYQSYHYGGHVPPDSAFAHLQSYGATYESTLTVDDTMPRNSIFPCCVTDDDCLEAGSKPVVAVFWLSSIGALFVLAREWGPETFFLGCAMVLLTLFGALILISRVVTFVPPTATEDHEASTT